MSSRRMSLHTLSIGSIVATKTISTAWVKCSTVGRQKFALKRVIINTRMLGDSNREVLVSSSLAH